MTFYSFVHLSYHHTFFIYGLSSSLQKILFSYVTSDGLLRLGLGSTSYQLEWIHHPDLSHPLLKCVAETIAPPIASLRQLSDDHSCFIYSFYTQHPIENAQYHIFLNGQVEPQWTARLSRTHPTSPQFPTLEDLSFLQLLSFHYESPYPAPNLLFLKNLDQHLSSLITQPTYYKLRFLPLFHPESCEKELLLAFQLFVNNPIYSKSYLHYILSDNLAFCSSLITYGKHSFYHEFIHILLRSNRLLEFLLIIKRHLLYAPHSLYLILRSIVFDFYPHLIPLMFPSEQWGELSDSNWDRLYFFGALLLPSNVAHFESIRHSLPSEVSTMIQHYAYLSEMDLQSVAHLPVTPPKRL